MTRGKTHGGGFLSTWSDATFRPGALFSRAASKRSRWRPVPFALVVTTAAWSLGALAGGGSLSTALAALIAAPVMALASIYVVAALTHAWLVVVRGRNAGFAETLACVCYSSAPALFGVVPIVGPIVGAVWRLVILTFALTRVHRLSTLRAALAVFVGAAAPVLLALGLRAGFIEAFKVPGGSMAPTLMVGDHMFVNKWVYGPFIPFTGERLFSNLPPRRGDAIVFRFPENERQDFVKRAVALPGDTLEAVNGRVMINGWLAPHCHVGKFRHEGRTAELYVEYLDDKAYLTLFDTDPDEQTCSTSDECSAGLSCHSGICGVGRGPFKVAPGEVWVMGDNRNNSHDSPHWRGGRGAGVPFRNVKGRTMFIWMSFGPDGGVVEDRLFLDLDGAPEVVGLNADLAPRVDACLRNRPPLSETTPPRGSSPQGSE
ncbi:signal peptidase I [Sorangium sp. So ce1128]